MLFVHWHYFPPLRRLNADGDSDLWAPVHALDPCASLPWRWKCLEWRVTFWRRNESQSRLEIP
jgi:hypothetical protein